MPTQKRPRFTRPNPPPLFAEGKIPPSKLTAQYCFIYSHSITREFISPATLKNMIHPAQPFSHSHHFIHNQRKYTI